MSTGAAPRGARGDQKAARDKALECPEHSKLQVSEVAPLPGPHTRTERELCASLSLSL
jgi:hypothetical protein